MTREITDLRAGVVGTGFIGVVHVDALRRLGIEIVGVAGSSRERAEAKGIAPAYDSYEALLEDERVDVVHLTTPNHLHYPQVKQALAAGKHIVCEKPLALTAEQSGELLRLAEQSGLVHCTNFNIRFYPQVQQARELARSGTSTAAISRIGSSATRTGTGDSSPTRAASSAPSATSARIGSISPSS
jgi:predicted dehydrogenase